MKRELIIEVEVVILEDLPPEKNKHFQILANAWRKEFGEFLFREAERIRAENAIIGIGIAK